MFHFSPCICTTNSFTLIYNARAKAEFIEKILFILILLMNHKYENIHVYLHCMIRPKKIWKHLNTIHRLQPLGIDVRIQCTAQGTFVFVAYKNRSLSPWVVYEDKTQYVIQYSYRCSNKITEYEQQSVLNLPSTIENPVNEVPLCDIGPHEHSSKSKTNRAHISRHKFL